MKINEIVNKDNPKNWANTILKDCIPYLQKNNKRVLFRGVQNNLMGFNRLPVIRNRKPLSTPNIIHEIAGDWFKERFGINYRADALFATGSISQARGYGNMIAVFPIGEFKFCWSAIVTDMTADIVYNIEEESADIYSDPRLMYKVNNSLNHAMYQTTNLKGAINSNNEIMIYCNEYYTVDETKIDDVMYHVLDRLDENI